MIKHKLKDISLISTQPVHLSAAPLNRDPEMNISSDPNHTTAAKTIATYLFFLFVWTEKANTSKHDQTMHGPSSERSGVS